MSERSARIRLPETAAAGDTVEIRARIMHPMENGLRRDSEGRRVPRHIVRRFSCRFEGETVIDVDIEPSVSADPFVHFAARVPGPGRFRFVWVEDDGTVTEETREITVS